MTETVTTADTIDAGADNSTPVRYWPAPGTKVPTVGSLYRHFKNQKTYVVLRLSDLVPRGSRDEATMVDYIVLGGGEPIYVRDVRDFLALVEPAPGELVPRFQQVEVVSITKCEPDCPCPANAANVARLRDALPGLRRVGGQG